MRDPPRAAPNRATEAEGLHSGARVGAHAEAALDRIDDRVLEIKRGA